MSNDSLYHVVMLKSKIHAIIGRITRVSLQWPTINISGRYAWLTIPCLTKPTQQAWQGGQYQETTPQIQYNCKWQHELGRALSVSFTPPFHKPCSVWHATSSRYWLFHHFILFRLDWLLFWQAQNTAESRSYTQITIVNMQCIIKYMVYMY